MSLINMDKRIVRCMMGNVMAHVSMVGGVKARDRKNEIL